jgi:hypothetical protein
MVVGRVRSRIVAFVLVFLLPVCLSPSLGRSAEGVISGIVLESGSRTPLSGVRVHLADPSTGVFYTSETTETDGTFTVDRLPAASYEVGVERQGGLYVVENRVNLAPGQNYLVELAIGPGAVQDEESDDDGALTFWQNPVTAALLVVGGAALSGLLLDNLGGDEQSQSPLVPIPD